MGEKILDTSEIEKKRNYQLTLKRRVREALGIKNQAKKVELKFILDGKKVVIKKNE